MIERGENPGLALEPGEPLAVGREDFRQDFDGDVAGKLCVLGVIDNAHTATADLLENSVLPGDKAPLG